MDKALKSNNGSAYHKALIRAEYFQKIRIDEIAAGTIKALNAAFGKRR